MKKRKIDIQINNFPKTVQTVLRGAEIFDTSCRSGATVLYSDQGYYIKIDEKGKLCREAEMIGLFSRMGMGAELAAYVSDEKKYFDMPKVSWNDLRKWV